MEHESHYLDYNIGSLGILVKLSFKRKKSPRSIELLMETLVRTIARKYKERMGVGVLRAKAFLKSSKGFIKADIAGADRSPFIESNMKQSLSEAKLAINLIAQGLSDEEVKTIAMEALEVTLAPKNGRISTIRAHETHR